MSSRNEEPLENYLRRFKPVRPRPLPVVERKRMSRMRWPLAAAALIVLAFALILWNGLNPGSLRSTGSARPAGPPGIVFGEPSARVATLGRLNALMRGNPVQLEAQLTAASRQLLPDVAKPGSLLHGLAAE